MAQIQSKVEYNATTDQPEIIMQYGADATSNDEKLLERFAELLVSLPAKKVVIDFTTLNGIKTAKMSVVVIPAATTTTPPPVVIV